MAKKKESGRRDSLMAAPVAIPNQSFATILSRAGANRPCPAQKSCFKRMSYFGLRRVTKTFPAASQSIEHLAVVASL
jgi:hypothetical protein